MSKLKYIKIYEAFDSSVLSKIIGYIKDRESRENFIKILKILCNKYDFPLSKLDDSYIEYLPFNKALLKKSNYDTIKCTAKSSDVFRKQYAIEGEFCKDGVIKRKWGNGTREVKCTKCNGTGLINAGNKTSLLKFWFNKDGQFIQLSAVDGFVKNEETIAIQSVGSPIPNDKYYTMADKYVLVTIRKSEVLAYLYPYNGSIYAIQNKEKGSCPSGNKDWMKYGSHSYVLGRDNFKNMKPVEIRKISNINNPFSWNFICNPVAGEFKVNYKDDLRDKLKNADFAILIDLNKLSKSSYNKASDIKSSRTFKSDIKSNEDIKKQNIERYISKLSSQINIPSNISDCNRLVNRSIGYRKSFYIIVNGIILDRISKLIELYILLIDDNVVGKKHIIYQISSLVNDSIKYGIEGSNLVENGINYILQKANSMSNDDDRKEKVIEIIKLCNNISDNIYEIANNYNIQCIEDLEIVYRRLLMARDLLMSNRYNLGRFIINFINKIYNNNESAAYLYLMQTDLNPHINNLRRVKLLISKI